MQPELSDRLKAALKRLIEELYYECRPVRDEQISMWRRNEAMWRGIQDALLLGLARDINLTQLQNVLNDKFGEEEDRTINIIKAHGEAIISALSANLPKICFAPEDADNSDDISTAKVGRKIADLIEIQNEANLKIVKMLYYLYYSGITFTYNCYHRDKKYGVHRRPQIDYKTVTKQTKSCPQCGDDVEESALTENNEINLASSMGMQSEMPSAAGNQMQCPTCQYQGPANTQDTEEQIPYVHSYDDTPKGRLLIDVYGPLHVTIPHFVRKLDDAGFLRLDTDLDYALVKEIYPDLKIASGTSDRDRISDRAPSNSNFTYHNSLCTVSRIWLRSWVFNRLADEDLINEAKQAFPNGCYYVQIDDQFAEACDENLDDYWTCTYSEVSEYIHAEPLMNPLVPIQIMVNDIAALCMKTVEQGVQMNFVDPQVVDLEAMAENPAEPGDMIPVKAVKAGVPLDHAFYQTKPANLSREVEYFNQYLEKMGQFSIGSLPSIWGGQITGGSKTLGEYRQSKEQSLQRLSLPWKAISSAWMHTIYKGVLIFINNMIEDEHYVKTVGKYDFRNVFIRKTETAGKIGNVYVENSDQLPLTWSEKREFILNIMEKKIPQLEVVMYHPENVEFMERILGLSDLYIPGDDDRSKQLMIIKQLISEQPMMNEQMMQSSPSVTAEPIDNHQVCAEVTKAFLNSEAGQLLKMENPAGYQNVMANYQQHMTMIAPPAGPPAEQKPNEGQSQQ